MWVEVGGDGEKRMTEELYPEEIFEIVVAMETDEKEIKEINLCPKQTQKLSVQETRDCFLCGKTGNLPEKYFFKSSEGQKCNKKRIFTMKL